MCSSRQVPAAHVTRLDIIPDVDASSVSVTAHASNASAGLPVQVDVYIPDNGTWARPSYYLLS